MEIKNYGNFTVVLPTLNEAGNIANAINAICRLYPGISVIVADDGSRDNTQQIVIRMSKKNGKISLLDRRKEKVKGLTASVAEGIMKSRTEYVIVMDADMQHPPEKIKDIARALLRGCNAAVAVRRSVKGWEFYRKAVSKSLIYIGYLILYARRRSRCSDIFSGYFGTRRSTFSSIFLKNKSRFVMDGYKILFDMLKCMPSSLFKVCEVPYTFGLRKSGRSKAGLKQGMAVFRSFLS